MKLLTPNELVSVLPASAEQTDDGLLRFESFATTLFRERGSFKRMVDEGFTTPEVVCVNEVPSYLLAYHQTPDGGLWIDMAQTLKPNARCNAVFIGIDLIAHKLRCPYVRFFTKRAGVLESAQRCGFVPEGVMMTKGLA